MARVGASASQLRIEIVHQDAAAGTLAIARIALLP